MGQRGGLINFSASNCNLDPSLESSLGGNCPVSPGVARGVVGCDDRATQVHAAWLETTMGKRLSVDDKLAALGLLRNQPISPEITGELRRALGDRSNLVVAS